MTTGQITLSTKGQLSIMRVPATMAMVVEWEKMCSMRVRLSRFFFSTEMRFSMFQLLLFHVAQQTHITPSPFSPTRLCPTCRKHTSTAIGMTLSLKGYVPVAYLQCGECPACEAQAVSTFAFFFGATKPPPPSPPSHHCRSATWRRSTRLSCSLRLQRSC